MKRFPIENLERINEFAERLDARLKKYFADMNYTFAIPEIEIRTGDKYAKIVVKDPHSHVHSFVEIMTGNIYKAASWNAPTTKHVRGNVFADDYGMSAVGIHGANLLA